MVFSATSVLLRRSVITQKRGPIPRMAALDLVAVAIAAPFLLFPSPGRIVAALLMPAIWIAHAYAGEHLIPPTPFNRPLLLLLLMVGVSLGVTFDLQFSLGKIAGVLLGTFVVWASARWTTTRTRLQLAAWVFQAAGAGLATIALLGTNWFAKFTMFRAITIHLPAVIRGLPGAEEGFQPNAVAGLLILFVPFQLALLVQARRRARGSPAVAAQVLLLAVTSGTLVLTQSRGAWAGLVVATLAFLLWHGKRTRALALAASGAIAAAAVVLGPASLLSLLISRGGTGIADSAAGRLELWSRAAAGIRDFPITGMGMNAFRRVMPILYPTVLTSPDVDVAHAHNHLLQAALDLGIPGLLAYLWIWVVAAVLLVRVYRHARDPLFRAMAAGLGAGLIAHFSFGMTDAIALGAKAGVLFWLALAMVAALHQVALADTPPTA